MPRALVISHNSVDVKYLGEDGAVIADVVGSHLDTVHAGQWRMFCNADAKRLGEPLNIVATMLLLQYRGYLYHGEIMRGTVAVLGNPVNGHMSAVPKDVEVSALGFHATLMIYHER